MSNILDQLKSMVKQLEPEALKHFLHWINEDEYGRTPAEEEAYAKEHPYNFAPSSSDTGSQGYVSHSDYENYHEMQSPMISALGGSRVYHSPAYVRQVKK